MNFDIKCGEYRHFKGNPYVVYGTALLDGEKYVLYQHDYGTREFWIRPLNMFTEIIERDGKTMERFSLVCESSADKSFERLMEIVKNSEPLFNHSETLETYVISAIDASTGEITLISKSGK